MSKKVNHPPHYNGGNIEAIDVIEDWDLDFNLGNAVKYICRAEHKGSYEEDIEKAIWYLRRSLQSIKRSKSRASKHFNIQLDHFVNQGTERD